MGEDRSGTGSSGGDHRDRWPWLSLLPLGLGSWAPLIAAARYRVWWWALPGLSGVAMTVAGLVLAAAGSSPDSAHQTESGIGGLLLIGSWIGGIAASFAIRSRAEARRGAPSRPRPPWPRPTRASRQWSVRYALIAFVATMVATILVGLLLYYVLGIRHVSVGVGVLVVDAMLLAGLVPLARRRGLSAADLGLRRTLAVRSLGLALLALLAYLVFAAVWLLVVIGDSPRQGAGGLAQISHLGAIQRVLAIVAIAVLAPVVEEIFFRGLLYRSFRNRLPIYQAALAAGLLFGLAHILGYPPATLPVKAAFGVIACLLYERTGALLPGIALHAFVDASAVDLALTGDDNVVLILAGALAIAILLHAAVRRFTGARRLLPLADAEGDLSAGGTRLEPDTIA